MSWAASLERAVWDRVATRGRLLARLGISGMTSSTASSALARFGPYRHIVGTFQKDWSLWNLEPGCATQITRNINDEACGRVILAEALGFLSTFERF